MWWRILSNVEKPGKRSDRRARKVRAKRAQAGR
jgi:hypothetical protein